MNDLGRILIGIGLFIVLAGGLMILFSRLGLGRLPGDIAIRRGSFTFYFPLATSIVLSIVLSVILTLILRRR